VIVAALANGGLQKGRYLVRRLRDGFPSMRILVGRWGLDIDAARDREILIAAGADRVSTTLLEARSQVAELFGEPEPAPPPVASGRALPLP
jgi:hypothetical protein